LTHCWSLPDEWRASTTPEYSAGVGFHGKPYRLTNFDRADIELVHFGFDFHFRKVPGQGKKRRGIRAGAFDDALPHIDIPFEDDAIDRRFDLSVLGELGFDDFKRRLRGGQARLFTSSAALLDLRSYSGTRPFEAKDALFW